MLVRGLIADLLPVRAAARKVMTVCRLANGRPDAVPGMVGATRTLGHLRTYRIERALPRQPPGTGFTGPGFRKAAGVYLCGDHLWSASIEGAIISGLRTADAILKPS